MSRHPTVLQVLPALGASGGVERGTVEIAQAIVEAGGRSLVASSGGPLTHEFTRLGAQHFTLPLASKNPLVMRANIQRLATLIGAEDVDIVHARSRAPAWSSYLAARRTGRHFVTTFHGTYSTGNWLKRRYNSVMTRGERVIAISAFIAGHVRRVYGVPASHIRVIHRGVDLERFDPARVSAERVVALANQWRLPDGVPVVMLPGRLTRWKGQIVFIEAIAKLGRRDIRAVLVGSEQNRAAYRGELEALIERHGLNEVVRIVDHCKDMPAAYMLTDVVVSASTDPEAFGRVIPEAQALGRPVVATDHGGARETVIPDETGWLTAPGDTAALAAAIERVLGLSAAERARLAEKSVANVRGNFTKDTMCAKTLDVYNEVLALESPPLMVEPPASPILVIKLGALGDFAQGIGPFAAIRRHHAGDHVTLLTTAPYAPFAEAGGWFDAVWIDARPPAFRVGAWLALRRRLRAQRFRRVYDLQTSDRSAFYYRLFWPGPMPEWSGIARGCSHPHANPRRDFMHTQERQDEQLRMAGIAEVPGPDLSWVEADGGRFQLAARYAVLVAGGAAHRPAKRWPVENYAALAAMLDAEGIEPVLLGADGDNAVAAEIRARCPAARDLTGQTELLDIAALARGAAGAVGNDTGPMHLIAIAGCPSVVLYSHDSDPALCAQRGPDVTILRRRRLAELAPGDVKAALRPR